MTLYLVTQRVFTYGGPRLGTDKIIGVVAGGDAASALAAVPPDAVLGEGWDAYEPEVTVWGEIDPGAGAPAFLEAPALLS